MGMKTVYIGRIAIGEGNRPLVIPEIGINHGRWRMRPAGRGRGWLNIRRTLWRMR